MAPRAGDKCASGRAGLTECLPPSEGRLWPRWGRLRRVPGAVALREVTDLSPLRVPAHSPNGPLLGEPQLEKCLFSTRDNQTI